jgi:hypothetical protein
MGTNEHPSPALVENLGHARVDWDLLSLTTHNPAICSWTPDKQMASLHVPKK